MVATIAAAAAVPFDLKGTVKRFSCTVILVLTLAAFGLCF